MAIERPTRCAWICNCVAGRLCAFVISLLITVILACARQQAPATTPPPPPIYVTPEISFEATASTDHEVGSDHESGGDASALPSGSAHKDQPAYIKLHLGHFANKKLGVGVTIDRTERTDNVADIDPVKVRFDGERKIWRLQGRYGTGGRIDYVADTGTVLLHVWENGSLAVRVPDPDNHHTSDEIYVERDGDADPL